MQTQLRVLQSNRVLGDWAANVQRLDHGGRASPARWRGLPGAPGPGPVWQPRGGRLCAAPSFFGSGANRLAPAHQRQHRLARCGAGAVLPAVQDGVLVHAVSVVRNGAQIAHGGQQHLQGDAALLRHCQPMVAAPCQFRHRRNPAGRAAGPRCTHPGLRPRGGGLRAGDCGLAPASLYAGQPQALEAALAAQAQAVQRPVVSSQLGGRV